MLITVTERQHLLLGLIDQALQNATVVAEELQQYLPEVLISVREAATGMWVEKTEKTRKGDIYTRVYQKPADIRAARLFCELVNAFPDKHMGAILSYSKHLQARSAADLGPVQKKFLQAQAKKTMAEAVAYELSFITDETLRDALMDVMMAGVNFVQSVPREEFLLSHAGSDEDYRRYVERLSMAMVAKVKELLPDHDAEVEKKIGRQRALPPKLTQGEEE